jgi:hypothetical protein
MYSENCIYFYTHTYTSTLNICTALSVCVCVCFTGETRNSFIITDQIEVQSAVKHSKLLDLYYTVAGLMQICSIQSSQSATHVPLMIKVTTCWLKLRSFSTSELQNVNWTLFPSVEQNLIQR